MYLTPDIIRLSICVVYVKQFSKLFYPRSAYFYGHYILIIGTLILSVIPSPDQHTAKESDQNGNSISSTHHANGKHNARAGHRNGITRKNNATSKMKTQQIVAYHILNRLGSPKTKACAKLGHFWGHYYFEKIFQFFSSLKTVACKIGSFFEDILISRKYFRFF